MKKLILLLSAVFLFANIKLINQKIEKDSIIISYKVDKKTFQALKQGYNDLVKNTQKLSCSNIAAKKLIEKYNLIYHYKSDNNEIKVEVKKGSCK